MDLGSLARVGIVWMGVAAGCTALLSAPQTWISEAEGEAFDAWSVEDAPRWSSVAERVAADGPDWFVAEMSARMAVEGRGAGAQWARDRLSRILEAPQTDAHALFRIAVACRAEALSDWCSEHDVHARLEAADADNAPALLLAWLDGVAGAGEATEVLARAAEAPRWDSYHSRGVAQLAVAIEDTLADADPFSPGAAAAPGARQRSEAVSLALAHVNSRPKARFARLVTACEAAAGALADACTSLARRMARQGLAQIERRIGEALLAGSVASPQAADVSARYNCWVGDWLAEVHAGRADELGVAAWLEDLDARGEWDAGRRLHERSGAGACAEAGRLAGEPDFGSTRDATG